MTYKLMDNVFFKKIADDQVNILLADNDNFIFKLNKVAARVFLMLAEQNMSIEDVRKEVISITRKPEGEIDLFLTEFYKQMTENKFLTQV
jgi:hypothetical protein